MTAPVPHRPRTLSKSDYKLARTCEAKLFFRENRYPEDSEFDPYMHLLQCGGYMVEALAKASFDGGIQLEYGGDPARELEIVRKHLDRDEVTLFEATLLSGRRQARVDILRKAGNTLHLIEVKSKSFNGAEHFASLAGGGRGCFRAKTGPDRVLGDWEKYLEDVTYQVLLAEKLFPGLRVEPWLIMVDKSKRVQVDDVPTLFELERRNERVHTAHFIGDRALLPKLDVLTQVSVVYEVGLMRAAVEEAAAAFEGLLDEPFSAFVPKHGSRCRDCEFNAGGPDRNGFRECWGRLADATPHVLELFSAGTVKAPDGTELIDWLVRQGKASLSDVPVDTLRKKDGEFGARGERQRRQIELASSGKTYVSPDLAARLESIRYPAHFVDFEVSRLALPYHSGMRPYGQVAFQWSADTVTSVGPRPEHAEWLNGEYEWPNEKFARSLRARIGDTGSVLTWSKFERTTLREVRSELGALSIMDKELAQWIHDVCESRIVDMHEWATSLFYYPAMGGRTSIKVVFDAIWKQDSALRDQFAKWTGRIVGADTDPYSALAPLHINGVLQDVHEGTGAIRAYEAMMYGVEKSDEVAKAQWRELLLQYCALDSISMALIFEHLRRLA